MVVPQFQKMQKEGESGRRQLNQWTRILTVAVTLVQASAYVAYLTAVDGAAIVISKSLFTISTMVVLTTGTLFVMWMGEKITDKGIGNGTSLIIMVGILARLPHSIVQEFDAKNIGGGGGLLIFLIEIAVFIAVIVGLILLTQGTRKIPLNYARRIIGSNNAAKEVSGARDFIPLKVNSSGVMPIIFAQAILFIPATVTGFAFGENETAQGFIKALSNPQSMWYNICLLYTSRCV